MRDYTTLSNEELYNIASAGGPGGEAAFAQLNQNLEYITVHKAAPYLHKMATYDLQDLKQEGRIVLWKLILKNRFKGRGTITALFSCAVSRAFINLYRNYCTKNLIYIGKWEDREGNTIAIMGESEYIKAYREKQREWGRKYYERKRAEKEAALAI